MRSIPITLTLAVLVPLAVAAVLAAPAPAALAKSPFVTYSSPEEGDVLSDLPPSIQLCFKEPIDISDAALQQYRIALTQPGGERLPLRVYFQNNAYGILAQTHPPAGDATGEWTFEWAVKAVGAQGLEQGSLKFSVAPEGEAPSTEMPLPCDPSSGKPASPEATATGETGANPDADDGPDVLLMSLLTVAASLALAVLGFIGYAIRMKTGFWLHRPPVPGDQAGGPDHH